MKIILFLTLALQLSATTFYIDNTATGANNGKSWIDAWKDPNSITGVAPKDIVYVSGGKTSQTYVMGGSYGQWSGLQSGGSMGSITYQVGQDAGHNGIVIFKPAKTTNEFVFSPNYVTISGKLGSGSDNICHFVLSGFPSLVNGSNTKNLVLEYIDTGNAALGSFNPVAFGFELSHCICTVTGNANAACFAIFSGTGYDTAGSIHDCTINIPYDTANDGFGSDGLQWGGSGFSVYNNTIKGYPQAGARGNHQDGWQGAGVQYVKFYNNTFIDIANYCLFGELPNDGNVNSHVIVSGNTCINTRNIGSQAIAFGGDSSRGKINTDVIYIGNTANGFALPLTLRNPSSNSDPKAFISCYVYANKISMGSNILDPAVITSAPGVPPVVVPPVIIPPSNAKISTSVSTISSDGKTITTVVTFDKSIYQ